MNYTKRPKWLYSISMIGLLLLYSCQNKELEYALSLSGSNRQELEKVLQHYKGDEMKYKAACFLISNMPGHARYDSLSVKRLQPYYDECCTISAKHNWERTDEWKKEADAYWEKAKPAALSLLHGMKTDIHNLKAEWLIREIDLSFRAWQENAYSCSVSFDEFCQYILPYRIHDGICADDSRSEFYQKHAGWFADNKIDFHLKIDSLLYQYKDLVHNDFVAASLPLLSLGSFKQMRKGLCDDRCKFNIALLSALGIPVAQDFVPAWGNRSGAHSWNVIILNGEAYPFEPFWDKDRWKYKKIYNNECSDLSWGAFRLPKVYRNTYEINIDGPLSNPSISRSDIPSLFRNPFMKDVSSQYFKTTDVEVELTKQVPNNIQYCYLCVYGAKEWQPVQWGKIEQGKRVVFKSMGRNNIYFPMFYQNGEFIPAASAFLLNQEGKCEQQKCTDSKMPVTVRTYTSYLFPEQIAEAKKTLVGAYLLGSNELISETADTLCCLTDSMDTWNNIIKIKFPNKYRHIRLVAPSDTLGLCEISFYETGKEEKSITNVKAIANMTSLKNTENISMMTDQLSATGCIGLFNKNSTRTICFDLNRSTSISRIEYTPYTHSYLYKEYNLDLFYWKEGWILAGNSKGNEDCITFDNVPEGTIYRAKLKGLTDRIFTYKDGTISWF